MAKEGKASIVIRKEEVVEGGHHGGAWKVAYADFVTAMMAFFLLMWLLNATTEEQRKGLADYFTPQNILARNMSGSGAPFGGLTPNSDGALASDRGAVEVLKAPPITRPLPDDDEETGDTPAERSPKVTAPPGQPGASDGAAAAGAKADPAQQAGAALGDAAQSPTDKDIQAEVERREKASFERAAQQIREAIAADPSLAELGKQLMVDVTPEGLRVQLVDAERSAMFTTGSATLNERARAVLAKVAPVLMRLPEQISIAGHTDAAPYKGPDRTNWDLSADRANATRRMLVDAGLPEGRIRSVTGMADRDPLIKEDKLAAGNRRIAIVVLHDPGAAGR